MSLRLLSLAVLMAAGASGAVAQTPALEHALSTGVVGERFDGYLGFAATPGAQVRSQVSTINIHRRALYSSLASRKGASAQDVGVTAGCQLLDRVTVGEAYMLSDGVWRRRGAGQGAPVPDYCR